MQDITGMNIIFIISGGVLTFVILFIFAKRQITRFALRSRRGPHISIGADAKKCLKKEIDRRIEAVPRIVSEPRLLNAEPSQYILEPQQPYHYRFRAVDDVKTLEDEISRQDPGLRRRPRESLRSFLVSSLAEPLDNCGQKLVHQFCDTYEFARHHPGEFGEDEYQGYSRLLLKLLDAARVLKSVTARRGSPLRSPARRPPRPAPPPARPAALASLAAGNKLPAMHKHYTALENMPSEQSSEQVLRVTVPRRTPPRDETAV